MIYSKIVVSQKTGEDLKSSKVGRHDLKMTNKRSDR